jgi:hypothetical protein
MTRAEYEAKYGTPPPDATSGPVRMTRAEYEAKYGPQKPTLPKPQMVDRVTVNQDRGVLGAVNKVVGTLGKPFVDIAATPVQGLAKALGQPDPYAHGSFAGVDVSPIDKPLKKAGSAVEVGSYVLPEARVVSGLSKVFRGLGAGSKLATRAGEASATVAAGYGTDVGANLSAGKTGTDVFTPGVGTAVGGAIPAAGALSNLARLGAKKTAPAMVNSLIKPLSKQFSYGKDPGRTVSELGITANSLEELTGKISAARQQVGADLQRAAMSLPPTARTSLSQVLQPFNEAIKAAVERNDQALYNRLTQARDGLTSIFTLWEGRIVPVGSRVLDDLTYAEALEVKRKIGDLTKWTGQRTEDETVNGALTRAWGLTKDALDQLADEAEPGTAAKLRKLNEQYGDLTSAEIASKYRDVIEKRHNLINLPGKIGLTGSVIAGVATGGLSAPVAAAAVASILADKALSSAAVKTRLAAVLSKMRPAETDSLIRQLPFLKSLVSAATPVRPATSRLPSGSRGMSRPIVMAGAAAVGAGALAATRGSTVNYDRSDPLQYVRKPSGKARPAPSPKTYVIGGVDIAKWATDPKHEQKVTAIYKSMPSFDSPRAVDAYIKDRAPKSRITGNDVWQAARKYGVDAKLLIAMMQQDSSLGTAGLGKKTNNPANVGNDDDGNIRRYRTMREGVEAAAKLLAKYKVKNSSQLAAAAAAPH